MLITFHLIDLTPFLCAVNTPFQPTPPKAMPMQSLSESESESKSLGKLSSVCTYMMKRLPVHSSIEYRNLHDNYNINNFTKVKTKKK